MGGGPGSLNSWKLATPDFISVITGVPRTSLFALSQSSLSFLDLPDKESGTEILRWVSQPMQLVQCSMMSKHLSSIYLRAEHVVQR